jgi:hypothetical protein
MALSIPFLSLGCNQLKGIVKGEGLGFLVPLDWELFSRFFLAFIRTGGRNVLGLFIRTGGRDVLDLYLLLYTRSTSLSNWLCHCSVRTSEYPFGAEEIVIGFVP